MESIFRKLASKETGNEIYYKLEGSNITFYSSTKNIDWKALMLPLCNIKVINILRHVDMRDTLGCAFVECERVNKYIVLDTNKSARNYVDICRKNRSIEEYKLSLSLADYKAFLQTFTSKKSAIIINRISNIRNKRAVRTTLGYRYLQYNSEDFFLTDLIEKGVYLNTEKSEASNIVSKKEVQYTATDSNRLDSLLSSDGSSTLDSIHDYPDPKYLRK